MRKNVILTHFILLNSVYYEVVFDINVFDFAIIFEIFCINKCGLIVAKCSHRWQKNSDSPKCCKNLLNQTPSWSTLAYAKNYDSIVDKVMHVCFLVAHEVTPQFNKKMYPKVDLHCSRSPT